MRIVGGRLGGRRFPGPPGDRTRPTAERVREAIASKLEARGALEGARVLDLFAGTGALGFEALSRGAARAVLVEADRRVAAAIARSAGALGLTGVAVVVAGDLLARGEATAARIAETAAGPFDLVLADPPYAAVSALPGVLARLEAHALLAPDARVVVEHAARDAPPALGLGLEIDSVARYGDSAVALYARTGPHPNEADAR